MQSTLLTIAIGVETVAEARAAMDRYAGVADLAELRLDLMGSPVLADLLRDKPMPVICTNRAAWEGGRCEADDAERLRLLCRAAELGAEWVDWELARAGMVRREDLCGAGLILSRHDFTSMPDLGTFCRDALAAGADVPKAVGMAVSPADALVALDALSASERPAIALAMGPAGIASRILAFKHGAFVSFASTAEAGTAPGQIPVETMLGDYRVREIDRRTVVHGVLCADPPQHRWLGEANAALRAAGRNAVVVPLPLGDSDPIAVALTFRSRGFADLAADTAGIAGLPALEEALLRWTA